MTQIIETQTREQCQQAGGVVVGETTGYSRAGERNYAALGVGRSLVVTGYKCALPEPVAPAPTPAQITVSPNIQTQVSPQISPVFQQQFQPQNSPATAGTVQSGGSQTTAPPPPPPPPATVPTYTPGPGAVTGGSDVPGPSPLPPPGPVYTAPPPVMPVSYPTGGGGGGGSYFEPEPAPAPAAQQTPAQPALGFDWKMLALVAAGGAGAMILTNKPKR